MYIKPIYNLISEPILTNVLKNLTLFQDKLDNTSDVPLVFVFTLKNGTVTLAVYILRLLKSGQLSKNRKFK